MSLLTQALTSLRGNSGPISGNAFNNMAPNPGNTAVATGPSSAGTKQRSILPEYACIIACRELDIRVVAQLPDEIGWGSTASYDTPFKDAISGAVNMIPGSAIITGIARAAGMSLMTQTLTARVWNGSTSSPITLNLVLQANADTSSEVMKPLVELMALTVPHNAGGTNGTMLRAPGPYLDLAGVADDADKGAGAAFGYKNGLVRNITTVAGQTTNKLDLGAAGDRVSSVVGNVYGGLQTAGESSSPLQSAMNSAASSIAAGAGTAVNGLSKVLGVMDKTLRKNVRNVISIRIGNYMMFENVVVTDVQQTHRIQPVGLSYGKSSGQMQRVEVAVTFEPFFDLTLNDLGDVFLDPNVKGYVETLVSSYGKS